MVFSGSGGNVKDNPKAQGTKKITPLGQEGARFTFLSESEPGPFFNG